jgi:hypothetical protein
MARNCLDLAFDELLLSQGTVERAKSLLSHEITRIEEEEKKLDALRKQLVACFHSLNNVGLNIVSFTREKQGLPLFLDELWEERMPQQ